MEEIIVRKYERRDREAIRRIFADTAFRGQPLELFFEGREILQDAFTSYYTDYEPESVFIACVGDEVVGYLTGSKDTVRKNKIFSSAILPWVVAKFIFKWHIFKRKNISFVVHALGSFFHEKHNYKIPPVYPAHLHINVDENFRRHGVGEKLMHAFFDYLKENNIGGVHLSTFSDQGKSFFIKCGFQVLWDGYTHQWHYLLGRDVETTTLGKLLA